jgi:Protein of unknown function (DUF3311)
MVLVLIVLHQDNWFWTDDRLLFGFLPIGLFYQMCISLAAGALWWWATIYCWPSDLESADPQERAP